MWVLQNLVDNVRSPVKRGGSTMRVYRDSHGSFEGTHKQPTPKQITGQRRFGPKIWMGNGSGVNLKTGANGSKQIEARTLVNYKVSFLVKKWKPQSHQSLIGGVALKVERWLFKTIKYTRLSQQWRPRLSDFWYLIKTSCSFLFFLLCGSGSGSVKFFLSFYCLSK